MNAPPDISQLRIDKSAFGTASRRRRPWVWIALAAIAAAGITYWMLGARPVPVRAASVVTTFPSAQYVVLTASGYVVAQRKAAIATKATGRLEELTVREGSVVKRGDLLARIDARDVRASLEQARANVGVAQANLRQAQAELDESVLALRRALDLLRQRFVSQSAVDQSRAREQRARAAVGSARAAVAAAQANETAARVAVDFTEIRAPFDGVVLQKSANVGDVITPFSNAADSKGAVVTLADLGTLEVEADVSESSLGKVSAGQPCEILLDALPEARLRGSVAGIVPTVDRSKATVMTKVRFEAIDPRVLPDMSAKVNFLSQAPTGDEMRPLVAVPAASVARDGERATLWRIRPAREGTGEIVEPVVVRTGRTIGELVEVTGDVKTGERVVVEPPATLKAGAAVAIETKN